MDTMDLTHPAPADDDGPGALPPLDAEGEDPILEAVEALTGAEAEPDPAPTATGIRGLVVRFAPLLHKLWRYAAVSVIATGTSLTILGVLVQTRTMPPGWANLVATAVGTIPSFELNRRWVWAKPGRRQLGKEVVPYVCITGAGLVLSTITVSLTGHYADHVGWSNSVRTFAVEVANLTAFGIMWVIQFAVLDRILFRHDGPASGDDTDRSGHDQPGSGPTAARRGTATGPTTAPRSALERVVG